MAKHRILVVDDEEDARNTIGGALEEKYEVLVAWDGLDALDKADRYQPDFVVIDVMMPLMDGFRATSILRKKPGFEDTPVMFLSAKSKKEDMMQGYLTGATLFIPKPCDPERVLKNIMVFIESNHLPIREKKLTLEQIVRAQPQDVPFGKKPEEAPKKAPPVEVRQTEEALSKKIAVGTGLRPRAMIIDDDPSIISIIDLALGDGYEVVSAKDGMEALEKIILYEPDVLLVDIMMPRLSGYQLCKSLRRSAQYRYIPIIIVTAKESARDHEYALKSGADEYVKKPFEPRKLKKIVDSYVTKVTFTVKKKKYTLSEIKMIESSDKGTQSRLSPFSDQRDL